MDSDILLAFFEEVIELLQKWEETVLRLESGFDPKLINELFRIAHNIKGSSHMVELGALSDFIHEIENVITFVRENEESFSHEYIDLFLEAHAILLVWIDKLPTDRAYVFDYSNCEVAAKKLLVKKNRLGNELIIKDNLIISNMHNVVSNYKFDKSTKMTIRLAMEKIDTAGIQYLIVCKTSFSGLTFKSDNEDITKTLSLMGVDGFIL